METAPLDARPAPLIHVLMQGPCGPESAFLQVFHCQAILPTEQMLVNLLSPFCLVSFSPPFSSSLRGISKDKEASLY